MEGKARVVNNQGNASQTSSEEWLLPIKPGAALRLTTVSAWVCGSGAAGRWRPSLLPEAQGLRRLGLPHSCVSGPPASVLPALACARGGWAHLSPSVAGRNT